MKFTLEFEYPIWERESKVAGLFRMSAQAHKQIEERLNHPERFEPKAEDEPPKKRGWPLGKKRKPSEDESSTEAP